MLLLTAFIACSKSESNNEIQELESIPEFIGVEQSAAKGLFCLKQQQPIPDSNGIIAEIKLQLPKFQNGVYYRPFSEKLAA
jgi:hypothetical protein